MSVYDLDGRTALVTGGARGLGAGMAEALARAGASVMIGDVLKDEGSSRPRLSGQPAGRLRSPLQILPGQSGTAEELKAFVKQRIGSVKTPKQVEIWPDLPRSKVVKVLKTEIKAQLRAASGQTPP